MKYLLLIIMVVPGILNAQYRTELIFREDFKEIPSEIPISQNHIENPNLIISLYGSGADLIKKSHHNNPIDDPYYVWSGLCDGNWAVTLKHKTQLLNFSEGGRVKMRFKQSGFRQLHIILKLADDTWLISDLSNSASSNWQVQEFNISEIKWMLLDIETITENNWIDKPDLTKIEEVGWTDLMIGGGSAASSRVDWVEVYSSTDNK